MHQDAKALPWESPEWQQRVESWIGHELSSESIELRGPINFLHQKAWSALASIPTSAGTVFFKAPAPSLRFEARLTQTLIGLRPESMADLISIHPDEGWMLMRDSGETLRQHIHRTDDLHHWHKILPHYAEMQRDLARNIQELLDTGIADRRLAGFPELYRALLMDTTNLRVGKPAGLSRDEHQRLLELIPSVSEQCQQLANFHLPETLCHEEVHDANVLIREGRYLFVDWSDSCVGHPFFTMLVTIRSTAYRLKLDEFAPEMLRLRDVYLDAWADYGSMDDLRKAFEIAYRLAMINRSLAYQRVLGPLPEPYKLENDAIPGWLQDYLVFMS